MGWEPVGVNHKEKSASVRPGRGWAGLAGTEYAECALLRKLKKGKTSQVGCVAKRKKRVWELAGGLGDGLGLG